MAGARWGTFFDLEERLLSEGHTLSFLQAIRLIRLILRRYEASGVKDAASPEGRFLRIKPQLSLAFPSADVATIEAVDIGEDQHRFVVDVTFLGLYGTSSPLPSFYTEDLLHEAAEDRAVTRDFIDIVNHALYPLFVQSLLKYNLFLQLAEEKDNEYLERLYCLVGLGSSELRQGIEDAPSLLRYAGLLTQFPRSAVGLRVMLKDALGLEVKVLTGREHNVPISQDQQASLGVANSTLASDLYMGSEFRDSMCKFRIVIGPVTTGSTEDFLPGGKMYEKAAFLTRHYLTDPLEYEIEVILARERLPSIRLGEMANSKLGITSWLPEENNHLPVSAVFVA